jgi:hypothetical protein
MFRVTFPAPMMKAPKITFEGIPPSMQVTLLEVTTIGFTVIFSPTAVPLKEFPKFQADTRL